jgi:peptide chain release factor 3
MQKAVEQLSEEGTVQLFYDPFVGKQDPIIGVVGELQFDVLLHRLNDEYGLDVKLERLPYSVARWPVNEDGSSVGKSINGGQKLHEDAFENPVVLLNKEWDLNWLQKENPELQFAITAP